MSAFFIVVFLLYPSLGIAKNCVDGSLGSPEFAVVKWVYDGDSLLLTDKRKIRVIGIDTPEVRRHKQKDQPYGAKAREALRELLKRYDYQIVLRFGEEKLDHYARHLAHVYTPDGINISNWLLEKGFARTLSIPPNVRLADCYKRSEQHAQDNLLRIWRLKSHKVVNAENVSLRRKGFVRLKGKIIKIKFRKKSIKMELASNKKRPIIILITKNNLTYFNKAALEHMEGQVVEVSGILKNHHGKRIIYLNHPTQLAFLKRRKHKVAPVIKWSIQNEK